MKKQTKTFKEKWNETDKLCPKCNQITERSIGLTKQNLHRLVFQKPTIQDLCMLFVIIMVLLMAWRYNVETQMARDTLNNLDSICSQRAVVPTQTSSGNLFTNFTISPTTKDGS